MSQRGSGGRAPHQGPPRRSFLDTFLAPRPSQSPFPTLRSSLARGMVTTLSTPALVVGVPVVVLLAWLALVAAGFQGPFAIMVNALAIPPLGTLGDVTLTSSVFGAGSALVAITIIVVVRSILLALIVAAAADAMRLGSTSRWTLARALRVAPTSFAVNMLAILLLLMLQILVAFLGGGVGLLLFVGGMVIGIAWLGFAPVIAATEGRRLTDTILRSVRAARISGSGNITLAALYVVPAVAVLLAPGKPGGLIGVNPSIGAWVLVIVTNLLHVGVTAAFAYRYLAGSSEVPDAPAPRAAKR